jgi:hypothetical protein
MQDVRIFAGNLRTRPVKQRILTSPVNFRRRDLIAPDLVHVLFVIWDF